MSWVLVRDIWLVYRRGPWWTVTYEFATPRTIPSIDKVANELVAEAISRLIPLVEKEAEIVRYRLFFKADTWRGIPIYRWLLQVFTLPKSEKQNIESTTITLFVEGREVKFFVAVPTWLIPIISNLPRIIYAIAAVVGLALIYLILKQIGTPESPYAKFIYGVVLTSVATFLITYGLARLIEALRRR